MLLPLLVGILAPAAVWARKHDERPCAANPFADPKLDACNSLGYIASDTLTAIAFSASGATPVIRRLTPQLLRSDSGLSINANIHDAQMGSVVDVL
jgi:hypothetical protein